MAISSQGKKLQQEAGLGLPASRAVRKHILCSKYLVDGISLYNPSQFMPETHSLGNQVSLEGCLSHLAVFMLIHGPIYTQSDGDIQLPCC